MKHLLLSILLITLSIIIGNAQTAKNYKHTQTAEKAAIDMCECMNSFFNELHPQLIIMLNDIAESGEEKAGDNFSKYYLTASDADKKRIETDLKKMQKSDEMLDKRCAKVKKKYAKFKDKEFEQIMMNTLSTKSDCRLIYNILKK